MTWQPGPLVNITGWTDVEVSFFLDLYAYFVDPTDREDPSLRVSSATVSEAVFDTAVEFAAWAARHNRWIELDSEAGTAEAVR